MTTAMKKRSQLPVSERPEKKALSGQLKRMNERDLLALVLGSGVVGANVKEVAATALRKFGEKLLAVSPKDICSIRGIGEVKAAKLAAAFELYRRLCNSSGHPVRTMQDVRWLCHDVAHAKQEILGYLALDVRNNLIKNEALYRGTESVTVADPKLIFRTALGLGAHSLIIYHNHPSGSTEPSKLDIEIAERLARVGTELNLPVLDFVILSRDGIYSLLCSHKGRNDEPAYVAEGSQQITLATILGRIMATTSTMEKHAGIGFSFIDLFAGIGGIRLAFEAAGGQCVFSCEWNKYAQKTYERNFGEIPWGNIRDITGETKTDADVNRIIPDHDVLTAGFPCQPFSLAGVSKKNSLGLKHGFDDPTQGTLFFDIKRILKVKRPAAFFLENVKHLVHHDKGRTFEVIRRTLEDELGYVVKWEIVDAAKWVPQSRKRIFIVGYNPDKIRITKGEIVIPLEPGTDYHYPELNRIIRKKVDEKYILGPGTWATLERHKKHHAEAGNGFGYGLLTFPIPDGKITRTISARYHKDGAEILVQANGSRPRRLTVEEAAQLQGYDHRRFIFPVSDTQAYRQIGNSVAVPAVEATARRIAEILEGQK